MPPVRLWLLLTFVLALTGCTRAIDVDVSFAKALPVLSFRTQGFFPRSLPSVCLWRADIIDDRTDQPVMSLLATRYERDCARVPKVTFAQPEKGLKRAGQATQIVAGRSYHAEVITDEGDGRSKSWQQ